MSALLLIGIVAPLPRPQDAPPHVVVEGDGWQALALEIDPCEAETEGTVLNWASQQNAILSAYVGAGDVLPLPLGAVFSNRVTLHTHVRSEWSALAPQLKAVAGAYEYVLRIEPTQLLAPAANTTDGASFLRDRLAARKARASLSERRHAFLHDLVKSVDRHTLAVKRRAGTLFYATLLVPRSTADTLIAELSANAASARALGLKCTLIGPSPVYSFSEAETRCA